MLCHCSLAFASVILPSTSTSFTYITHFFRKSGSSSRLSDDCRSSLCGQRDTRKFIINFTRINHLSFQGFRRKCRKGWRRRGRKCVRSEYFAIATWRSNPANLILKLTEIMSHHDKISRFSLLKEVADVQKATAEEGTSASDSVSMIFCRKIKNLSILRLKTLTYSTSFHSTCRLIRPDSLGTVDFQCIIK